MIEKMTVDSGQKTLTTSPTNLKEAIDWILRLTGKDGTPNTNCLCLLSEVIHDLVRDVEGYLDNEEKSVISRSLSTLQSVEGVKCITGLINSVGEILRQFIGWQECKGENGSTSGHNQCSPPYGCHKFTDNGDRIAKKPGYQSPYKLLACNRWDVIEQECKGDTSGSSGTKLDEKLEVLAKILIGSVTLVFTSFSYLYWLCHQNDWSKKKITESLFGPYYFFGYVGYPQSMLNQSGGNGKDITGTDVKSLLEKFAEFKKGDKVEVTKGKETPYGDYISTMYQSCKQAGSSSSGSPAPSSPAGQPASGKQENCLLTLYIIFTGYFRKLQYSKHGICSIATLDNMRNSQGASSNPKGANSTTSGGISTSITNCPQGSTASGQATGSKPDWKYPRTIREILYWLTSLPYSPMYHQIHKGLTMLEGFSTMVLDSSIISKIPYCLMGTCHYAPIVLMMFQGNLMGANDTTSGATGGAPSTPGNSTPLREPLIHSIYSNSIYNFRLNDRPEKTLVQVYHYLYAMYYRLYFLFLIGNILPEGARGWYCCRYGPSITNTDNVTNKDINWMCTAQELLIDKHSWYCGTTAKKDEEYGNQTLQHDGTPSPLQAFLTDCLKGFKCKHLGSGTGSPYEYPPLQDHLGHNDKNPHRYCPVPMGFRECYSRGTTPGAPAGATSTTSATLSAITGDMCGKGICEMLRFYSRMSMTQCAVYELLTYLTMAVNLPPSTLGDLFGFFNGLVGNGTSSGAGGTQKHEVPNGIKEYITKELPCLPGMDNSQDLLCALCEIKGLQNLGSGHNGKPNHCDLGSLNRCGEATPSSCGKYMDPVCGTLYGIGRPQFAPYYLWWIIAFAEHFHKGLKKLLDDFRKIDCQQSGCTQKDKCQSGGCTPGTHGDKCCCENVVKCAGVLPLFYQYGFIFMSPNGLSGSKPDGKADTSGQKHMRKCETFHEQLQKVIKEGPFSQLHTQIHQMLYALRLPFGIPITSLWILVMVYLLWSMTFNLDLIHIQSHWRSPGSYLVPLQRILADGSRKGFCSVGYFQVANGDRLLSQGINDLYL